MIGLLLTRLTAWASRLSYPRLLALVATLFVIDLLVPDFVPFIDEILLGLATAALASRKKPATLDGEARVVDSKAER